METNLFFKRKIKGLFLKFKLHKLFSPFDGFLMNLIYLSRFSKWKDEHSELPFSDFYNIKFNSQLRPVIYQFLLDYEKLDSAIDYLEFGVDSGRSFKWWINVNKNPESRFIGFDTFTGLPENWDVFKAGDMTQEGQIPIVNDLRAEFHKGLFQQTLPKFLKTFNSQNRLVIHLDADLYSSTIFVMTSLAPFLKKDDILIFDEFGVPVHEFKAFDDFVKSYYLDYDVIYAGNNYFQLAIKVKGFKMPVFD
jgi:hypothetical protein